MVIYELVSESEAISAGDKTTQAAVDVSGCLEASVICLVTGTATISLQECDTSTGTFTDVESKDVVGDGVVTSGTNAVVALGYKGSKQFIKIKIDGTTTAVSAIVFKTHCLHCPTS